MSNIKVWAQNLWKIVGSGDSKGISTDNASLLEDGETKISVYTALERLSEWKEKSKAYIAWLAKNGGGGSGGGGGSTITEATCTIKVMGSDSTYITTGGTVVLGSGGITIQLADIDVKILKTWTITIRVGSRQVAIKSASYTNNTVTLSQSEIASFLENHTGALSINATYSDDVNGIYGSQAWNGSIVENIVTITCEDTSTSLTGESGSLANKSLDFTYSVGYLGDSSKANYRFIVDLILDGVIKKTYSEDIRITDTKKTTKSLALIPNLFNAVSEDCVGVYTIKASLTSITNSAITATSISSLTVISNTILISTTNMMNWSDSHTELGYYPQVSLAGSLIVDFTAYINGGTSFYYYISIGNEEVVSGATGKFGTKINQSISLSEKSWAVADTVKKIKLEVYTSQGRTGNSKICYYGIEFIEAVSSLLQERTSKISQIVSEMIATKYNAGDSSFTFLNNDYISGGTALALTSKLTPLNGNSLSVITNDGISAPYLRLSNGAVLKNENWVYNGSIHTFKELFPESNTAPKNLTISCCFKADYHADDYRTVLFCGTINSSTGEMISGISIDVHDVYIGGNSVCKLSDNSINMVDVVILQTTITKPKEGGGTEEVISYIAKVYVDGVMTSVKNLSDFPFPRTTNKVDAIYLGGRATSTGELINLCDCNIYSYKVYDTALTDYDIMINYINNKVTTTYYENGSPGYSHIDVELHKNFCERDADNNVNSLIYDKDADKYAMSNLTTNSASGITFNKDVLNRVQAIGIPMMIIDVSGDSNWTFAEFSNQQSYGAVTLPTSVGRRMVYWDPTAANSSILEFTGDVELQGHSTLADFVKNINITLPDETVFIPKNTWFPEKTYTLKADVVDSSHSNNAAIGQFINEALGPDENGDGALFPFDPTAISNVYNSNYKKNQQSSVTLKHTVTGFPVLLIMRFYTTTSSTVDVTPLGIYSFNLGRDAYRNLGFKKVNSIKFDGTASKVEVFPFLSKTANVDETDSNADWIEIANTSTMDISNLVDTLPEGFDSSLGDFWQNHANIVNSRYEVRYPANTSASSRSNFKNNFIAGIMELPIEGCASSNEVGTYSIPNISGTFNKYKCDADGTNYSTDGTCTMITDPNHFNGDAMGFYPPSFYLYFDIALMFGLIDNFGKNTTYRSWNGGKYYIDFYDLDSALGDSNQGELTIGTDVWLKYLYNKQDGTENYGYAAETFNKNIALQSTIETKVSANQNKLWLSLDTTTARSVFSTTTGIKSLYAEYWTSLMSALASKANQAGYTYNENKPSNPIVDWFMDKYFEAQTKDCGPLLFNLDYKLKYLMQFTSDTYNNMSALPKLHGRKLAYTRDWFNKHIQFLDSVFSWRGGITMNYRNNISTTTSNTVTTTRKDFPIKMNTPVIFRSNIGDSAKAFYFAPQNKEVWTNAGDNAGGSVLTWIINNSPNIISLGNDEIKLSEMSIQTIKSNNAQNKLDYEGLPAITVLDLSNNKTFSPNFTLDAFTTGAISEIRELNFSNTKSSTGAKFDLDLTYNSGEGTWFTKLIKINISNSSCINQVSIPRIPLQELLLTNSSITKFTLTKQAYLSDVDLTGCTNITDIVLSECTKYKKLKLSNLTQLTSVNISQCPAFEELELVNCDALNSVSIENCTTLKKITIQNCRNLTGSNNSMHISGCSALLSIDFSNCSKLTTFYIEESNKEHITTLNLSGTSVSYITENNGFTNKLNLVDWISLTNFKISGNSSVKYIQFANSQTSAIPLNNNFSGCANLLRVYGHVIVKTSSIFNGCSNFSIHGDDLTTVKYNNASVLSSGRVKMPWEFVNATNPNAFTSVSFMTGLGVTNMDFGTTNLSYNFADTSCTTFDIYYVLSNCPNATSLDFIFYSLKNSPFNWSSNVDNSPNRYIFKWCNKVTSLNYAFANPDSGDMYMRLFTPTIDAEGIITDNGIFSPLIDTLTSCYHIFGGYTIISNRYLFRHSIKNYKITNLSFFNINQLYENSNTCSYFAINTLPTSNLSLYGDFTDFYSNLPLLSALYSHMSSLIYINYNTLTNVPVTQVNGCFISQYGTGTLTLSNIFKTPANVTIIENSFRVNATTSGLIVSLPITDDTFSAFTNLQELGYNENGRNGIGKGDPLTSSCFIGEGINKYINQKTFPYDVVPNGIKVFTGLFTGCNRGILEGNPSLPGSLFTGHSNVYNVAGLFYNLNFKYTLEGNGFTDCTNLKNVSYLFASKSDRENYLSGQIPLKLFYHGHSVVSNTIKGVLPGTNNTVIQDTENVNHWIIVKNGTTYHLNIINGTPVWTDNDGTTVSENTILDSKTITYNKMNATINSMTGCFMGANTIPFDCIPAIEKNENYMPFIATYANKRFTNTTVNNYEYTGIWQWDGNYNSHAYISTAENLDAPSTITTGMYKDSVSSAEKGGSLSFICAPDLLRYCASGCNVTYLFAYSGHDVPSGSYGHSFSQNDYGIHGRIPPYLLYPLKNSSTLSIDYMFINCKQLSYYNENNSSYIIPKDFFSYCPNITSMVYTFSGMCFPKDINLTVFGSIPSTKLNSVEGTFYMPYFYNGTSTDRAKVNGIFQTHTGLLNAKRCFAATYNSNNSSVHITTQYVKFTGIFHNSFAAGGSRSKQNNTLFSEVFAYYNNGYVEHEGIKTLPDDTVTNNYKYYG